MQTTIAELKQKHVELIKRLNMFVRSGNYFMAMKVRMDVETINEQIADIERIDVVDLDNINNSQLKSWFGKSVSLSINCSDLSIYYLDGTINFLRTKGLTPKGSFESAANNFRNAANELRKEIAKFLIDYEDDNWQDFSEIEQMITEKKFTDREKVFKKQFEK